MTRPFVEVPADFLESPRWWTGGRDWLDGLPERARRRCQRWGLRRDGAPMHGSNALVLPVRRGDEPLALRLSPPDDRTVGEIAALRFWAGRGTVALIDADPADGAMLLERLDGRRSLATEPLPAALDLLGGLAAQLAVPDPPPDVESTGALASALAGSLQPDWVRLGRPFHRATLDRARELAAWLAEPEADLAVNGDLHGDQVLAGTRQPWLVVDPLLLRGDPAYDLARVLWSRLDEMADAATIRRHADRLLGATGFEPERAAGWLLLRTVDYWFWGRRMGLTEDPVRCARLVATLTRQN